MNGDRAPVSRCILVWLLASVGCAALLRWLGCLGSLDWLDCRGAWTELGANRAVTFDVLLPRLAALALAGCAVWFWSVTTWTALAAARGVARTGTSPAPGCPRTVQRLVLAACGLALVGAAGPAVADQAGRTTHESPTTSILVGLPLPDRASSERLPSLAQAPRVPAGAKAAAHSTSRPRPGPDRSVLVRPGDTLWALAAEALPDGASDAEITAAWHALYDANRDLIADPDLIFPGTRLHQPTQEDS